uniref:Transposase-associated domain-containing protein n=1 Tax=Chenopodium quinoa TaxID=63459 RepID=A0A803N5K4_CHEQI
MQYKKSVPRYKIGVKEFLEFAFSQKNAKAVVPCPCVKCNNERRKCRDEIELDLLKFGIVKSYTRWLRHGERVDDSTILDNIIDESNEYPLHEHDVMSDMLHDASGVQSDNVVGDKTIGVSESKDPPEATKNFYKLMVDLELELYPSYGKLMNVIMNLQRHNVTILSKDNHPSATTNLRALAQGPDRAVISVNGYMVNGFMFRAKDSERGRETQNSGIVVNGETGSSTLDYYGLLQEIIEVQYLGGNRVTLFKCDWWDVHSHGRGINSDCFNFISVITSKLLANDPYILATQAHQVFYVNDVLKPNWKVIVKTTPRNSYDVPELNDHDETNYIDTIYL